MRQPTERSERVSVGRILGAHGLRGEVRVRIEGGDASILSDATPVWLSHDDGDPTAHRVESVRAGRSGECRVGLAGISDRSAAEGLRGARLCVRAEDLPPLGADEYYAYELVGCRVWDVAGNEIGCVTRIWETGAQDLLVVATAAGQEHLIPMSAPILQRVDLREERVVVDPPPGLLEAPASR